MSLLNPTRKQEVACALNWLTGKMTITECCYILKPGVSESGGWQTGNAKIKISKLLKEAFEQGLITVK